MLPVVIGVPVLLLAFAFDWLTAGLQSNSTVYDYLLPQEFLLQAYGFDATAGGQRFHAADKLPACVPESGRLFKEKMDLFFDCDHVNIPASVVAREPHSPGPWQCNPVAADVYVGRDFPFTLPRMDALFYASGTNVGASLVEALERAHQFPGMSTRGWHDGFLRDPSPDLSYVDCPGYSIVRLRLGE
ncbi:MAG TPA: hypothetical protein VIN06_13370 [Devosia sp.]